MNVGIVYSIIDNSVRQVINPLTRTPVLQGDERLLVVPLLVYTQATAVEDLLPGISPS